MTVIFHNDKYITNYQYDNNGNTIEKVKSEVHSGNTGTQSLGIKTSGELPKTNSREYFKYNVFNQLSTYYSTTIGKYTTYKYLSNGYRCYKNVKGVESYFIWDGDEIGAEYDANGNVTDVLYRGNNLVRDSKGNNYVYDSHGSVTSILNDNGSKSKDYEYDAFGNIENETNASTYNPWQYCGEYTDQESGLIYLRNRYYDSETGRFINEDTHWNVSNMIYGDVQYVYDEVRYPDKKSILQSYNLYMYCTGNPVIYIDPKGLSNDVAVRKTVESKGGTVSWNKKNRTITVKVSNKTTILKEGRDFYISKNKRTKGIAYMDQETLLKKCGISGTYSNAFVGNASSGFGGSASKKTKTKGVENSASVGVNASAEGTVTKFGYNAKSANGEVKLVSAGVGSSVNAFPPSVGIDVGVNLVSFNVSKTVSVGPVDITVYGQINLGGVGVSTGFGPGTKSGVTLGVGGSIGYDIN